MGSILQEGFLGLSPTSCIVALAVAFLALYYFVSRSRRLPLPPGPPGQGFEGNANQLPPNEPWKKYTEWYHTYGPVVHIRLFNHHVIFLNTAKAVSDLLDKRSNIYSDRPKRWMHCELVGKKYTVFNVSSEHPRFKRYRRELNASLNPRALRSYHEVMKGEARVFLQGLLNTPEKFMGHIRRSAAGIIMKVAYGYTVAEDDDYFIGLAHESLRLASQSNKPGRWLVDYYPILRFLPSWFPGADFKRQAKYYKREQDKLSLIPHQWVKDQIAKGDYVESFTSRMLKPEGSNELKVLSAEEDDIIMHLASGLYAGAADTTVSALTSFFLVMCIFQDVQKRAQAEVDEVVGRNRLPSFEDQDSLPYVKAVMREVLRWAPVAPIGLPHATTHEDVYDGYRIPKGATVYANIWSLMYDESMYSNPFEFNPERFLPKKFDSGDEHSQPDPCNFAFGFGRRVCPGSHFAEESLLLSMTNVLSTFDIKKPLDEVTGKEVDVPPEYYGPVTNHPKPFKCRIIPRADALTLI